MAARERSSGSRVGVALALLGCIGLLGGAFAAGVVVGRHWPRVQVATGLVRPRAGMEATAVAERPGSSARAEAGRARNTRAPAPADAGPRLTFYEELTSPLEPPVRRAGADPPKRAAAREMLSPPARAADGFTVQVAAYSAGASADALRARLANQGFDASVSTVETQGGRRYRVRVGVFSTRDEASAVAERLVSQAKVAAVVVSRGTDPGPAMVDPVRTERDRGVTAR